MIPYPFVNLLLCEFVINHLDFRVLLYCFLINYWPVVHFAIVSCLRLLNEGVIGGLLFPLSFAWHWSLAKVFVPPFLHVP